MKKKELIERLGNCSKMLDVLILYNEATADEENKKLKKSSKKNKGE